MGFFECNIPTSAPSYIHPMNVSRWNAMTQNIHARTAKLNEALRYSGMEPNTFAEYAAELFTNHPQKFDSMTSQQLVQYVAIVADGHLAEPRLEWPNAVPLVDCRFLSTEEWEILRTLGIGGSDAAVLAGTNHRRSQFELFMDKTMAPELYFDPVKKKQSQVFFDRGHAMEPKVIESFCKAVGAKQVPEFRMFRSKKYPHSTANIDAIVRMPDGQLFVFEAKTSVSENVQKWSAGKIPPEYVPQTRQYPAVLDDPRIMGTYIGCLFTYDYTVNGFFVGSDTDVNRFMHRFVERSREFEERQLAHNEAFFQEHVIKGRVPSFDGQNPLKDVRDMWRFNGIGSPDEPEVLLSEDVRDAIDQYRDLKARKFDADRLSENLKQAMAECELIIGQELGNSEIGILPSVLEGHVIEVKYPHRSKDKLDMDKLKTFYPGVFDACAQEPSQWRQLSISELSIEEREQKLRKAKRKKK